MFARLPARYRWAVWSVGLLASVVVAVWLAVLARGPVLSPLDLALSAVAGLGLGLLAVGAFVGLMEAPAPVDPPSDPRTPAA